ncbi:MAG: hypothetical protein IPM12_06680 [Flavobacteriales bacterium]|nr:hypothetical protein [Flavobacteriales bacterium]
MDVQNCIKTIQSKPTGLFTFRVSYPEKIRCISELASHSDRYLDGIIISATRDDEPYVQEIAAAVIISRFKELKGVREVEERMSGMPLQTTDPAFWQVTRPLDEAVTLVSIASINGNGYVRQAALEQMSVSTDWRYIPFILRRAGDWVPQVRAQATKVLARYKATEFRKGFLGSIHDIESLLQVKRVDLVSVYQEVMRWLVHEVEPAQLLIDVQALGDASRFRVIRYLLAEHACGEAMLRTFLYDRSFLIRLATIRHVVTLAEDWSTGLLEGALNDPFPSVRTSALKELIRRDRATPAVLTLGLTDPSFDVRDMAAKRLALSRDALVEHYREHLKRGIRVVGCLLGLRDVKGSEYVTDVVPYTTHSDPTVRQAALMALDSLAPDQAYEHAMLMIVDRNKRIRAKAEGILLERHDQAVVDKALTLLASEQVMHRLAGLSLLNNFGGWGSLPHTLKACLDASPKVADQAWTNLNAWVAYARRLFTEAPPQEVERARVILNNVRAVLTQLTYAQRRTLDAVQVFLS